MSTPHEQRRVLALVVGTPAVVPASAPLAHLVTLAEAALALAPVVEVRAPDTVLLDASAAHLFGGEVGLAEAVLALVAQLELSARVGLADGAWPARALARFGDTRLGDKRLGDTRSGGTSGPATHAPPHEHTPEPNARETHGHPRWQAQMISRHLHESARPRPPPPPAAPHAPGRAHHVCLAVPGDNRSALAALPLSALELPAAVIERLGALGLDHLGALAELPTRSLAARFGALGEQAVRLARGIDPTPLTPHVPEEVPSEVHELEGGVEALEPLIFVSKTLAERLAARLAGRGVGATLLTLALTQESREVEEVPLRLTTPSTSTALWLPVLREAISALRLPAAVVRVRLTATSTAPLVVEQLALDAHPERIVALEAVLARLESRLGEGTVLMAKPADRHRPEGAYTLERFDPSQVGRKSDTHDSTYLPFEEYGALADLDPPRPTRLLAQPEPLEVVRVNERWVAVRLAHTTHAVEVVEQRERLIGEWWRAQPFDRTYVRVNLRGVGPCWIYHAHDEGRTYLHGCFD